MDEKRLSDRDQTADVSTREEVEIYGKMEKSGKQVRMKKRKNEEGGRAGNERILLLPGRVK